MRLNTSDELRNLASEINAANDELNSNFSSIKGSINNMMENWKDEVAEEYANQFTDLESVFNKISTDTESLAAALNRNADDLDEQTAGEMKQVQGEDISQVNFK